MRTSQARFARLRYAPPSSVMADKTFLGGAALNMAIDAETHVDFVYRHYAVHCFDWPMALLASNTSPDMRFVDELHEIRQSVNPIPTNLE
jgi:hypothetical protein